MPKSQTIKPAIYQIDLDRVSSLVERLPKQISADTTHKGNALVSYKNAHKQIIRYHDYERDQGISKAMSYELKLDAVEFGEYEVSVYSAQGSHPHPWTDLFGQTINDLFVAYPNLVAFISSGEACYAISAGQGHTLFEQFVDRQFALEVAKRIMTPSLDSTKRREISGAIYGQIQQYRTSQRISSSQTLGTVWNGISGKVTDEIRANSRFINIFDPDSRPISVDAGSSLQIKRSMYISKMPSLIDWIEELLNTPLTAQQEKDFSFMNGLVQVSRRDKAKRSILNLELASYIQKNLANPDNIDLDFSHRNFSPYQDASLYSFGSNTELQSVSWDSPPIAAEVFKALRDNTNLADADSAEIVLQIIEELRFFATQPEPSAPLSATIIDHLHGEVRYDNKSYFLVDGTWYQASSEFLERLSSDFKDALESEVFKLPDSDLEFSEYTSVDDDEGGYNKSYNDKGDWLVTDKAFIERVELADLIRWDGEKLYIIHNKIGYGASVRDVCSQVSLSMNLLSTISETPRETLAEYYSDIVKEHYNEGASIPITEEDFIQLLQGKSKDNIVFVIGYIRKTKVGVKSQSSIAKYETVNLVNSSSSFGYRLRIKHIPKP